VYVGAVQGPSSFRLTRVRAAIWAAIALMAGLVLWPAVKTGWWGDSHEKARYAMLFDQFRTAVLQGHLYPRWLPDNYGGYGYPVFNFYQPGFFFTALPFSVLPTKPPYWLYGTVWTLLVAGAAGAYLLAAQVARRLTGKNDTAAICTGLFAAALFLMTPYLWVDLFVRGDLSEFMALCLTPWPLLALLRLTSRLERGLPSLGSVFLCGISLAAIVFSHPIVAMFALPTFGLVALYLGTGRLWRQLYPRAALALGLGLLLSCIYWYPLASLRAEVGMERAIEGHYQAQRHIVQVKQFFSTAWGFGGSDAPGKKDDMSFALGLPHFLLALAGLILGRKERALRVAFAAYLLLAALMTAAGLPLWRNVGLFKLVQFPWRLLAAVAALQILCAAGLAAVAPRLGWRRYAGGLAAILVVTLVWHHAQFRIKQPLDLEHWVQIQRTGARTAMGTHANVNEFLPKTARASTGLRPRGNIIPILELSGARSTPLTGDDSFLIHRRIEVATPITAIINQLYFPGWRVEVDGYDIPSAFLRRTLDAEGRMTVALGVGTHTLRARYDGPPGWRFRVFAVLLGLGAFAAFWWRERRQAVPIAWPATGPALFAYLRDRVAVPREPDPVIEFYKEGLDRPLLRENLRRTPEERLRQLMELQRFAGEIRRAREQSGGARQ
jgi:hypothetical protein